MIIGKEGHHYIRLQLQVRKPGHHTRLYKAATAQEHRVDGATREEKATTPGKGEGASRPSE